MTNSNLPIFNAHEAYALLKRQVKVIEQELATVEQKTIAFENTLRAALANELIEVQELSVLYKEQKRAKKEKRLGQKKRGKNYQAPEGLIKVERPKVKTEDEVDAKERKRLYREAMLHVHPDKFSAQEAGAEDQMDLATEMTSKLIDIYKSGSLEELQMYHGHIFSGKALAIDRTKVNPTVQDTYLEKELDRLRNELLLAQARHTYKVLVDYDDPLTFINELKAYYQDRIQKLKRRTRMG